MSLDTTGIVLDVATPWGRTTLRSPVVGAFNAQNLLGVLGVRRVLAPSRNEPDIDDIPEALRKNLDFVWVDEIGDVFDAALVNGRPGYARPRSRI